MPIRVANWDRQQKFLDPQAAMTAGSTAKLGPGAALKSLPVILNFLNDQSLLGRVKKEFKSLVPSVKEAISSWADNNPNGMCYDPADVGALIHLITYSGDAPIGMKPTVGFVDIFIGDLGLSFQPVYTNYIGTPGSYPTGPSNTTDRWTFFWYTLP